MRLPWLSVVVCVVGCAPALSNTKPASMSSSPEMQAMAANMVAMMESARVGQGLAEKACEPMLNRQVSWEEERSVGKGLAVQFSSAVGHLYLEGATEKDPTKLEAELAGRKPLVLPEGGRNAVSAHVALVGRNLAKFSSRPDLPWVFAVIENDAPQSFAAPGGYVFVTTGLLKKMTNEAQLAGVLSHEIAHVAQKDTLKIWVQALHRQCIAARYAAYLIEHGGPRNLATQEMALYAKRFDPYSGVDEDPTFSRFITATMMSMIQLGQDKTAEFETDRIALELVSFAGYDAVEYEKFLAGWPQPTHPKSDDRVLKLKALREGELRDFGGGTAKPELNEVFAPLNP